MNKYLVAVLLDSYFERLISADSMKDAVLFLYSDLMAYILSCKVINTVYDLQFYARLVQNDHCELVVLSPLYIYKIDMVSQELELVQKI